MLTQTSEAKNPDEVFAALCATVDFLDSIHCKYFLAGGTLLGALRGQDIIPHDADFDVDCFEEDRQTILDASNLLKHPDLAITVKQATGYEFPSGEVSLTPSDASCLYVRWSGIHVGDIYLFSRFSDGLARRFHPASGTYYNAKMTMPSYFYSGNTTVMIRGRSFSAPRHPHLVVEKIYGPDWRTPLARGAFMSGRNQSSGSVLDSDLETLLLHAVEHDSTAHYNTLPEWPAKVARSNSRASISWIRRHEPALRENIATKALLHRVKTLATHESTWKFTATVRTYAYYLYKDELHRIGEQVSSLKLRLKKQKEQVDNLKLVVRNYKKDIIKLHKAHSALHKKASATTKTPFFLLLCLFRQPRQLRRFLRQSLPGKLSFPS
jgi:hypothetical protein